MGLSGEFSWPANDHKSWTRHKKGGSVQCWRYDTIEIWRQDTRCKRAGVVSGAVSDGCVRRALVQLLYLSALSLSISTVAREKETNLIACARVLVVRD